MISRKNELEQLKTNIDLREYARSLGYVIDKKGTGGHTTAMRNATDDKVLISRDHDNHYIYCSVRDDGDHGSIIDFVQKRKGGSLGDVRKELRPWLSGYAAPTPCKNQIPLPELKPASKDLLSVQASYAATHPIKGTHDYLEQVRRIPKFILTDLAFSSQIRIGKYGNAVFPHYNLDGLCGFEIKNTNFTSFAKGGEKGIWSSKPSGEVHTLVVAETAIDALSYAALKKLERARYVSLGGTMNPNQPVLLAHIIRKLPDNSAVIAAMDNDKAGHRLAEKIITLLGDSSHATARFVKDMPSGTEEDWNDVLHASVAEEAHIDDNQNMRTLP